MATVEVTKSIRENDQATEQKFWLGHCQHKNIRSRCMDCRLARAFWEQVIVQDEHLIWVGQAAMGVGVMNLSGFGLPGIENMRYAHEIAWYMVTGEWQTPLTRTCKNRQCVRFEHIAIGRAHDPSKIIMEQEVNTTRIRDLLRIALHMQTPWFEIVSFQVPDEGKLYEAWQDISESEGRELRRAGKKPDVVQELDFPVSEGGAVFLAHSAVAEGEASRLDLAAIRRGLTIFQRDYFIEFEKWRNSKDDAEIANVFLNCCLFGRVIFDH